MLERLKRMYRDFRNYTVVGFNRMLKNSSRDYRMVYLCPECESQLEVFAQFDPESKSPAIMMGLEPHN